jgi:chromosome segregation ATPase
MIELMKSIKDIQNAGQNREEGLNKVRREADIKINELEKSIATAEGSINLLSHEKSTLKESLDTMKQERDDTVKELNEVRKKYDDLKTSLNSEKSQLVLERELRIRSEQKEHDERSERIAISAQMLAMTKEYAQMEAQLKDSSTFEEVKWRKMIEEKDEQLAIKENELKAALEEHMALQVQIEALKHALQSEKTVAFSDTTEEMSKLKGELRVLKERMKLDGEKIAAQDVSNLKKIKDLETQIQESQAERRR